MTPSRPYFIRALYDWIIDNSLTPYLLVHAEKEGVIIPREYVKEGKIILNISATAINKLLMNNDAVEFDARFAGVIRHLYIPTSAVLAIYAQENGKGMAFSDDDDNQGAESPPPQAKPDKKPQQKQSHLKIVK